MTDITVAVKSIVGEINHKAISLADESLEIMRDSALDILGQDGTGRAYKISGGKRRKKKSSEGIIHIASAPGEPPAPMYGNLRKNWKESKSVGGSLRIRLKLKSKMKYFKYLQFGTSKMAKRPIIEPVKKDAVPKIRELYAAL